MSTKSDNKIVMDLKNKQKCLNDIRHAIKRKKLFFDESKDKFGMEELSLLMKVKNTSEVKGYPFKVIPKKNDYTKGLKLAIKIVPIETKYNKNEHPCQLENIFLRELTENIINKNRSPHVTHYLGTQKIQNKCRALKQLNLKRLEVEEKIRTHSNMLIAEYVEGGSLDNWIFTTYENDQEITDDQWRTVVFQLIYTIAVIQKEYKMMHNDFHYGNILIDTTIEPGGYFVYQINNKTYYLKNTGIIPKLWDLEFCMAYTNKIEGSYPNKFITGPYEYDYKKQQTIIPDDDDDELYNVPCNYNDVYDLHYFLTSLLDLYISQELFDWIMALYPEELIPEEEVSTNSSTKMTSQLSSDMSNLELESSKESNDSDRTDTSEPTETSNSSTTTSDTSSNSNSNSRTNSDTNDMYLRDGRLINGVEKQFELPTPLQALEHDIFQKYTKIPDDFDEKMAIYFKAGF